MILLPMLFVVQSAAGFLAAFALGRAGLLARSRDPGLARFAATLGGVTAVALAAVVLLSPSEGAAVC